jgi:pimeloyl-ACP methyl ester carboxylesterase
MAWFDVDEQTRLFYTVSGTGSDPVLFVHGWGCDSHDWMFQIPFFGSDHQVIVADNRGHGRSSGVAGFRPRIFAADLAALLRDLDSAPVIAVGHSLGASIVSALAVEHTDLVRAVVVVDPAYGVGPNEEAMLTPIFGLLDEPGTHEQIAAIFPALSAEGSPDYQTVWHHRRALGTDESVLKETLRGLYLADDQFATRPMAAGYLRGRTCPVLAFYVDNREGAAEWERSIAQTPYDATQRVQAGHWMHQERPEEINTAIRDWLVGLP